MEDESESIDEVLDDFDLTYMFRLLWLATGYPALRDVQNEVTVPFQDHGSQDTCNFTNIARIEEPIEVL